MPKYRVWFQAGAEASVEVEVEDSVTDPEDIFDAAYEKGDMPRLCAHCSGWGSEPPFTLGLGEAWEPVMTPGNDSVPLVERVGSDE